MSLTKVSYSMINGSLVSAADYGITGSGDETILICQAMNDAYANNKTLVWPDGTYSISEANIPAGTNYSPAMVGQGNVTLNLSGAVTFTIANGFSLENINFVTTHTYPNTTVSYFHLFDTGARAVSNRIYDCVIRNVSYRQETITDGTERAFSFARMSGGVTNMSVDGFVLVGAREGFRIDCSDHYGETISTIKGATFRNIVAENVQRVIASSAVVDNATGITLPTAYFGSYGVEIENFRIQNTLTQRDNFSGGARIGHSPIIGDLGLNPRIVNMFSIFPIEHSIYIFCRRGIVSNFYGSNAADIVIVGYSLTSVASADIHVAEYIMVSAHHAATTCIVDVRFVDGLVINVNRFKGTNLSGGPSGTQIRPFAVLEMSRSVKNVYVTAKGQYLNGGVISYLTNETQEAPFENIVIKDCFILDAAPTTNSTTFAAINEFLYGTYTPTLPWWTSPSGNLIQNVSIINNYFGQTTDTADTTQTTTVLGRGRSGTKLAGVAKVRNCSGFTAEGNICDGWVGDALTGFSWHYAFGSYMDRVMLNDTIQPTSTIGTTIINAPAATNGALLEIKATPTASKILGATAKLLKTNSSTSTATNVESFTSGAEIDAMTTVVLAATESQTNIFRLLNFSGEVTLRSNSGEYAIAYANGATLTGINVSANAAITSVGSKVCIYSQSNYLYAINNTGSTVVLTITQKGSFFA